MLFVKTPILKATLLNILKDVSKVLSKPHESYYWHSHKRVKVLDAFKLLHQFLTQSCKFVFKKITKMRLLQQLTKNKYKLTLKLNEEKIKKNEERAQSRLSQ